ncbi:phytoene/squalene synthase family protein [Bacteroidia bacterium]|jgi:phytoene synthase|nr:phytoene/squalene synthase family protein [Bacteroidia bacterium]
MKALFDKISLKASVMVTNAYSTSFSLGIRMLNESVREPVYAIYGFVRFADEIVDSFEGYDKAALIADFRKQTDAAIAQKISLNPILNSFQHAVNHHKIDQWLIDAFFDSMEMDLEDQTYDQETFEKYILGSAQVVGLMCLRIFCNGDSTQYESLKEGAMSLGSAFQKVNFLRDLKADKDDLGRIYFPGMNIQEWTPQLKKEIEADIAIDFKHALEAINRLPSNSKYGVYTAYRYYFKLFRKLENASFEELFTKRLRVPNTTKFRLLFTSKARLAMGTYFL